ncbi:MAG: hypothetical protein R3B68_11705 [Phycisphaerales bacterium]
MAKATPRIQVQWTETAFQSLRTLPPKVRKGLVAKAEELLTVTDPRSVHKPLTGPLQGYYRIPYSRYRAIYRVDESKDAKGKSVLTITITFIVAGKRAERSKDDVYRVAQKLVELGLVDAEPDDRP